MATTTGHNEYWVNYSCSGSHFWCFDVSHCCHCMVPVVWFISTFDISVKLFVSLTKDYKIDVCYFCAKWVVLIKEKEQRLVGSESG